MKKTTQPKPKNKSVNGMFDFKNIHTGSNSTNPGVLKAQADKKTAGKNLASYKAKATNQKALAIKKAQTKK